MPSLFLSGLMDQLIPPKMMSELYQVSMIVLNSRDHQSTKECLSMLPSLKIVIEYLLNIQNDFQG